jgi:uncharacterized short protein YbdD (DUF466 family)
MPMPSGEPKAEVKMMEAKLKDGTIVEVTELAVGGIVTIAGVPAPVGEHELESGDVIVLGDNGAIMEIKPKKQDEVSVEVEVPEVEDMSAKFAAFESATNEKFSAYENKFAQYEAKLGQANKVIEGLMQISKMLVEAPQSAPDAGVKTSNNFAEAKTDAKAEFNKFSKSICS